MELVILKKSTAYGTDAQLIENKKQEAHEGLCSTGIDLACFKRNQYVINIKIPSKFGEDQIVNGSSIVFKSCIIAILTISRAIIQPCMGRSGRFLEMNQTLMDI